MCRDLLSPKEAASRLGVSYKAMMGWIHSGQLPAVKIGGRYFVSLQKVYAAKRFLR